MPAIAEKNSNNSQKVESKMIQLRKLSLWDYNPRFQDYLVGSDERALIQSLLAAYRLEEFAKEIVTDFDLLPLEKIVVLRRNNTSTVYEDNRRVATYKCLVNPSLVDDARIRKEFENLSEKIIIDDDFELEAIVSNDEAVALRYIDQKHYKTYNEMAWGQYERDRYVSRTKRAPETKLSARESQSIFRANIGEMVHSTELPDQLIRKVLSSGYVSTLYRIVESMPGRRVLGYERLSDNSLKIGDESTFLRLLKIIIFNVTEKETFAGAPLHSRTLNTEIDKKKYLDSISAKDFREVDRRLEIKRKEEEKAGKAAVKHKKVKTSRKQKDKSKPSLPFGIPKNEEYVISRADAIKLVSHLLYRFPNVVEQLQKRHAQRAVFSIFDEYDVQDLLRAILHLFFDLVYAEEWIPSYLGKASRADFLIKNHKIIIEVKETSHGLNNRSLRQQLIEDGAHYSQSHDCKTLFCFIYDPGNKIKDKPRFIADMENGTFANIVIRCIFVQ